MTAEQANQIIDDIEALFLSFYSQLYPDRSIHPVSGPASKDIELAYIECFLYRGSQLYTGLIPVLNSDLTLQSYSPYANTVIIIKLEHPLAKNQTIHEYIIQNFIPLPLDLL